MPLVIKCRIAHAKSKEKKERANEENNTQQYMLARSLLNSVLQMYKSNYSTEAI